MYVCAHAFMCVCVHACVYARTRTHEHVTGQYRPTGRHHPESEKAPGEIILFLPDTCHISVNGLRLLPANSRRAEGEPGRDTRTRLENSDERPGNRLRAGDTKVARFPLYDFIYTKLVLTLLLLIQSYFIVLLRQPAAHHFIYFFHDNKLKKVISSFAVIIIALFPSPPVK